LFKSHTLRHFLTYPNYAGALFTLKTNDAIANSGVTQVFVMARTLVINKQIKTNPLKVCIADRQQVTSMHMCDIYILDDLPFPLMGHIIPELTIASLFGIHVLTKVGCKVTFSKRTCVITYNGKLFKPAVKTPLSIYGPCP
jgi:hypothetical protein